MKNALTISQGVGALLGQEYGGMIEYIAAAQPELARQMRNHGKSRTQFQAALLDNAGPLAGPTTLRNLRQILASIRQTEDALRESYHRQRRLARLAQELRQRSKEAGDLAELKAEEHEATVESSALYIEGAVRKLAALIEQAQHLREVALEDLDRDELTEEDFERDETRFHIMKAFQQATVAARANGGRIDHGNMIYLDDLGIPGLMAQIDVTTFLNTEADLSVIPNMTPVAVHRAEHEFLARMAAKYADCPSDYAQRKGLISGPSKIATITDGRGAA